jgi:hypothetical protein
VIFLQALDGTFGFSESRFSLFKGFGTFSGEFFSSVLLSVGLDFFLIGFGLFLFGNG